MKRLSKQVLTSAILASFVLGSSYTIHNQAFAAETNAQSNVQADTMKQGDQGRGPGGGMGFHGGDLFKETATLFGIEQSELMETLQEGKTLVQIAEGYGLTEDEYLEKLTAAITASMNSEVTAGTMTQDQADQMLEGMADRLKQQIENNAFGDRIGGAPDSSGKKQPPGNRPDSTATNPESSNAAADDASSDTLTDIHNHWAVSSIRHLVAKGILQGDSNHKFNPDNAVSREELAAMITRSFHLESSSDANTSANGSDSADFTDVPHDRWSYETIEASKDFFTSQSDASGKRSFQPAEGAKREDVAVTLVKVLLKQDSSLSLLDADSADKLLSEQFKDADSIPAELRPYVATAVQAGWIQGDDQGNFAPQKTISRAEIATLLDRLIGSEDSTSANAE
ncbi:S-layer homology domain-containing protein [Paenibacillus hexagrammi]|uniref:S-layer homology domain-containing protein n=1 Tax=Paenibacillus hexagrammi TaxID=2908839 RepID=A0ABY3SNP8_9BACL|nr:S-layer homology domain-containing protein [Paenibacillus sp. YPD9-1]UJF34617.1 S-layer homology domain-containing protein [Paenibacillus sp. YPD9-1]